MQESRNSYLPPHCSLGTTGVGVGEGLDNSYCSCGRGAAVGLWPFWVTVCPFKCTEFWIKKKKKESICLERRVHKWLVICRLLSIHLKVSYWLSTLPSKNGKHLRRDTVYVSCKQAWRKVYHVCLAHEAIKTTKCTSSFLQAIYLWAKRKFCFSYICHREEVKSR